MSHTANTFGGYAGRIFLQMRKEIRRRRLEVGEAGWGIPQPQPARLRGISATKHYRVAVIGAGSQGMSQCQGLLAVKGIQVVGLSDINVERLNQVGDSMNLASNTRFSDANEMLRKAAPLDMVSIATTAPHHVALGRLALTSGVKRILLEKPIDVSLREARAFREECIRANTLLAVNYSRRWTLDYRAINRCISRGFIGEPRSIFVTVGKGELGMHASHYFDLCHYLFNSNPAWVVSNLEPVRERNPRGATFEDPSGFCLFTFENGARAYIDFSSDLGPKDPFVAIKGTHGRITVDEQRMFWTLQSRSQRLWSIPFAEPLKSSTLFSRVAADLLSRPPVTATEESGLVALEMVIGSHLAQRRSGHQVTFPITNEDSEIGVTFP